MGSIAFCRWAPKVPIQCMQWFDRVVSILASAYAHNLGHQMKHARDAARIAAIALERHAMRKNIFLAAEQRSRLEWLLPAAMWGQA